MRAALLVIAATAMLMPALGRSDEKGRTCDLVSGVLSAWNGWPPNFRIEAVDGVVYGVPESDDSQPFIPDELLTLLQKIQAPVTGSFTVCPLGRTTSVPYDERPIVLVSILDYDVDLK